MNIKLKYPDAAFPEDLKDKTYKCEVSCYNASSRNALLSCLSGTDIVEVTGHKLNSITNELFPSPQTFYASACSDIEKQLEDIVSSHHVSSVYVKSGEQFEWEDFYNIRVYYGLDNSSFLEFHRTVDVFDE